MRSLEDNFWKVVGNWSREKPTIVLEITDAGNNWPSGVFRGTIDSFVESVSIVFKPSSGDSFLIPLRGCSVRSSEHPKPALDSELEDWLRIPGEADQHSGVIPITIPG